MRAALAAAILFCVSASAQQPTPAAPQKEKTAGEVFKNLQVLKDIPASQMFPTMGFVAGSLGVGCDHCHVNPFAEDKKPEKAKAREMMRMVLVINQQYFADKQNRVTCDTCHRGSTKPQNIPTFAESGWMREMIASENPPRPTGTLPDAPVLLEKYSRALGDTAKASVRSYRGSAKNYNASANGPITIQMETTFAGEKFRVLQTSVNGRVEAVYDGTKGWQITPDGPQALSDSDIATLRERLRALQVDYLPKYAAAKTTGSDSVNGHAAWIVELETEAGIQEAFFDQQSGLLLRLVRQVDTAFGKAPNVIELDDYRDVGGVKLPFRVLTGTIANGAVRNFEEIKTNVTLDPATFSAPPPK